MPIPFTGDHLRRLQTALLDAFGYSALRQMLQLELEQDLDRLVPFRTATLAEMVHDLIRHYARRPGGIHQLLRAAHNTRPTDVEFSALYQEWIALDFAPLAPSPSAIAPAIPQQRPPRAEHFMDRQQALAQLLAALQPGAVVTLCGPGGIGKTALAAEAIWQLPEERFPDGLITHSFYGRGQIDLACEHIARTLGEELKPSPSAAAQRALAGRQLLLLLDGAEEADDLPALLAIRGNCGVLVTSRRSSDALAVRHDIDPLPLADAIALLQAWGGQRASDITAAGAIAELVGRLPLALRLVGRYLAQHEEDAADYLAWLAETPLAALDLGDRREQSVPLLLQRSVAQVSAPAQAALGIVGILALAPFPADLVATALELPERPARQALGELVSYGLLLRPAQSYIVSHALIHTYARARLAPADVVIDELARHFTALIETNGADFALLNTLRPHVVALLHVCTTLHRWPPIGDLAWAIHSYLDLQGHGADRLAVITAALTAARAQQDRQTEGAWLGNLGLAYYVSGQIEIAIDYHLQALTISQQIGDRRGEGACLGHLGLACNVLGQIGIAINYHRQALLISQEIGDRHGEGADLGNLGMAYYTLGQVETAIDYYQQSLVIAQKIGDLRGKGTRLGHLGIAYFELGKVENAAVYYQQALTISQEIGDRGNEGVWLSNLGQVYYTQEQVEDAIVYYQRAIAIAQEIGDRRGEGVRLGNLGLAYTALGEVRKAIDHYQRAIAIARTVGDCRNEGIWLGNLGLAYADLGQVEQAIAYYQQAIAISREIGDRRGEGNHLGNLGHLYAQAGDGRQALTLCEQSLVIKRASDDRPGEGEALHYLGYAYYAAGDLAQALVLQQQAVTILRAVGYPHPLAEALLDLGQTCFALNQLEQAQAQWQETLTLARAHGYRRSEGEALAHLGRLAQAKGQPELARQHWQAAHAILTALQAPTAARIHNWLTTEEGDRPCN